MHTEQNKYFKSISPEKKLELALNLYYSARKLKEAGLRKQHPEWNDEVIKQKVREIFLYVRS
jgi:hypothetical protein